MMHNKTTSDLVWNISWDVTTDTTNKGSCSMLIRRHNQPEVVAHVDDDDSGEKETKVETWNSKLASNFKGRSNNHIDPPIQCNKSEY